MLSPAPLWLAFHERRLLVVSDADAAELPGGEEPPVAPHGPVLLAGVLDGRPCRAIRAADGAAPPGMAWHGLRTVFARTSDEIFRAAGRALQLLEWDETHRWCGRCGAPTETGATEHVRICTRCRLQQFPRISPAIIVAVSDHDRILLARPPALPAGMYSVLAGFVEPGETLEEAVRREVHEETNVHVDDVRYFGSQPWPFPHSLMVAFTARYVSGELRRDPAELEDAGWFTVDALPRVSPRISIARALIDAFVAGTGREPGEVIGD